MKSRELTEEEKRELEIRSFKDKGRTELRGKSPKKIISDGEKRRRKDYLNELKNKYKA